MSKGPHLDSPNFCLYSIFCAAGAFLELLRNTVYPPPPQLRLIRLSLGLDCPLHSIVVLQCFFENLAIPSLASHSRLSSPSSPLLRYNPFFGKGERPPLCMGTKWRRTYCSRKTASIRSLKQRRADAALMSGREVVLRSIIAFPRTTALKWASRMDTVRHH